MKRRFQGCSVCRKYCQLFTHEPNTLLGKQYIILPIQTNGGANAEKSQKQPLPLETCGPHLKHQCQYFFIKPNNSSIGSRISTQLCNNGPIGYNGTPNSPPKLPLSFDDHHQNLIHPFLDRPHSPSQTASGSNQPFRHNTLSGQTDRWARRQVHTMSALLAMLIESDAIKSMSNEVLPILFSASLFINRA